MIDEIQEIEKRIKGKPITHNCKNADDLIILAATYMTDIKNLLALVKAYEYLAQSFMDNESWDKLQEQINHLKIFSPKEPKE